MLVSLWTWEMTGLRGRNSSKHASGKCLFRKAAIAAREARAQRVCGREPSGTNAVRPSSRVNRIGASRIEMNENLLAELSARLAAIAAANPAKDLEKNFRGMLS